MYNTLSDLKKSIAFKGYDLDIDDKVILSSGKTAFDEWLEDQAERVETIFQLWGVNPHSLSERKLKRAEIKLITAFAIESLEFQDTIDPQSLEVAGEKRSFKKFTPQERAEKIANIKNEVYFFTLWKIPRNRNWASMSANSQLLRTFEKYKTTYITILSEVERVAELEALKQRSFAPLIILHAYWDEVADSEKSESGESQFYKAKVRILADEILDVKNQINQYCRVIPKVVVHSGDWQSSEEWQIETIVPKLGPGGFKVLELSLFLPKEGNQVRL